MKLTFSMSRGSLEVTIIVTIFETAAELHRMLPFSSRSDPQFLSYGTAAIGGTVGLTFFAVTVVTGGQHSKPGRIHCKSHTLLRIVSVSLQSVLRYRMAVADKTVELTF